MADQHHDDTPALANQVAADIPDIAESIDWHKTMLKMILGWHDSTAGSVSPPGPQRPKFRWKDADEIYIGAGVYFHDGTTRQTVFWDAEITFKLQSAGDNSDSDDYGADGWHYIYLDDSAIITKDGPELDKTCFLNETTAPTWSDSKHGWYNGSDRCIFAVYETGDEILEFFHDGGDLVMRGDSSSLISSDVDDTWTNVNAAATAPGFCTKIEVFASLEVKTTDGALVSAFWRVDDQTSTTGHRLVGLERIGTNQFITVGGIVVMLDSTQVFEVKLSRSDADILTIGGEGWYFPTGM